MARGMNAIQTWWYERMDHTFKADVITGAIHAIHCNTRNTYIQYIQRDLSSTYNAIHAIHESQILATFHTYHHTF